MRWSKFWFAERLRKQFSAPVEPTAARSLLKKEIREQLALQDPTEETRNRFRLRRLSPHADFEIRVEPWRVFYRVQEELVIVELVGRKKGNVVLIGGKEFEL